MNFAKYRVQLSTEKKYSSKYEYKYEYEYSIPACNNSRFLVKGSSLNQANAETTQLIPESNLHLPRY